VEKVVQSSKWVIIVAITACVLFTGMATSAVGQPADEQVLSLANAALREALPGADQLERLRVDRYNCAAQELAARYQELLAGRITLGTLLEAADRVRDSALALNLGPTERIRVHQQAVEFGRDIEKMFMGKITCGTARIADIAHARYWELDAEVRLQEEKRKNEKPKP
jgi:hypothetical protein